MTTQTEALKLALDALETELSIDWGNADEFNTSAEKMYEAIAAIKEALAQEQEPVAWRRREVGGGWQYYGWEETGMTYEAVNRANKNGFECEAVPATPPQRKPLTDEEIDNKTRHAADDLLDHIYEYGTASEGVNYRIRKLARVIEAAHGIKE